LLEIDWTDTNTQLLEAFAAWLSEHRPADVVMRQDKGAGNFIRKRRADLKSLSAWRLLKWTDSWEEAYLVSSGDGRSKALYSNHPKPWKEAFKRADNILRFLHATALKAAHR
jgi:hypothetical protein